MQKIEFGSNEEFIKKYNELKSSRQMGLLYGCSKSAVLAHAKKIGYDVNSNKEYKLTAQDKERIISLYNEKTSTELAQEYNVSRGMITKLWFDANLSGKEHRTYYLKNQDFFEKIDTDEKAYMLGFIAADGCLYEKLEETKQNILRFALQKRDAVLLERFKELLNTNKPLYETKKVISTGETHYYSHLEIVSDKIFQDINNLGLSPRKTYNTTWIKLDTPELQNAFIRGYFDGDGAISPSNFEKTNLSSVDISIAGFEDNLKYFQNYLAEIGIKSSIILDLRKQYEDETVHFASLRINSKEMKYKFLKTLYPLNCPIYLERKYQLAQKFINYFEQ